MLHAMWKRVLIPGRVTRIARCSQNFQPQIISGRFSTSQNFDDSSMPENVIDCWNCGERARRGTFFCICEKILPIHGRSLNFFELLGQKVDTTINLKELDSAYKSLQRKLHPDLYTLKCPKEQSFSTNNSALINLAYQTLRDPLKRVQHLLTILRRECGANDEDHSEKTFVDDPDLLMKMFCVRERLHECDCAKEVTEIKSEFEQEVDDVMKEIAYHFREKNLDAFAKGLSKLQFNYKIVEECETMLHKFQEADASSGSM